MRGATAPRVEVIPPYEQTYGPIATELMARAGKPLDGWQQDAVNAILAFGPDRQWLCFEYCEICSRQNGKSVILEARALIGFLLLGEELILWSAHLYKTTMDAFRRIRNLLFALGTKINDNLVDVPIDDEKSVLIKISSSHGDESFERLDTGARLEFIARSKGGGRGRSADLLVIDEAFAYTPEQQDAQMPLILARPNPQILYASSPPLTGDTGEILFDLRDRAEAADPEDSLGYRDWGLSGDLDKLEEIDLNDRTLWAATNPALGPGRRLTIHKMLKLRRSMRSRGGRGFARECLGLWPRRRERSGAIDPAQWADLLDPESRRVGDIGVAVDIAPERDYAAIGLAGEREDGLGHLQLLDYRKGIAWLVDRLAEVKAQLDPVVIVMGRGTYASLKVDLANAGMTVSEDPDNPRRGDLMVLSALDMSAATGQLLDSVKHETVRHIGQQELDDAVAVGQTRRTVDSIAWSLKGDDGDICPLVTVTEASYGLKTRLPLLQEEDYDVLDSIG